MFKPAVCACLVLAASAQEIQAQDGTGAVVGYVTGAEQGGALAGAVVTLEGQAQRAATDRQGAFRLNGVPAGTQVLVVTCIGRAPGRQEITVVAGRSLAVDVKLASDVGYTETVTVTSDPITEGQASALNQQKTALNITNVVSADQIGSFPDPNAAEALSRIPGVSIARDQGEGRYVLIRGTEARLNSILIDGERIPAPEGDLRQVALDSVPADQLQTIEVSKAITADMDGDSIGGAVNLITKQATSRRQALFSAAAGYNGLQDDYAQSQFSGTFGQRSLQNRLGYLIGGSATALNRGSENFEVDYDDGYLDELQTRDYVIERERYGLNGALDFRADTNNSFVVRGIYNKFRDYEVNNRPEFQVGDGRIERVLKNRQQDQKILSFSGTGNHLLSSRGTTFDYRLAWSAAEERQPDRLDTVFRQSRVQFAPNVTPDSIDPDNIQANPLNDNLALSTLNEQVFEPFLTEDREFAGSGNLRLPLASRSGLVAFLKTGVKFKNRDKNRAADVIVAEPLSTVTFASLQDQSFDAGSFLDGRYPPPVGVSPEAARAYFNALPASARVFDHESDASDYDANERIGAGYAMAEFYLGDSLMLLPGLRVEATKVSYTGYDVVYNDDGDYDSTRPITGGDTYTQWLPSFHLRYSVDQDTNVRAAFTRTLARPNYYDLVPYQLVFQEDLEIARGNTLLKPTTSNNLDFLVERYFRSVGVVSGGVFLKRLNDYIYPFVVEEEAFGDQYQVSQPRNGDSAWLWGTEIAFQNRLNFLPGALNGFGVYANYTFTDSSATFPGRAHDATLPGQSRHVGNFAIWYERFGFSARASWNFHGRYIDQVGESVEEDVFYDNHTQLDVNLSQRVKGTFRIFADLLNLTNAPLRYYIGAPNRPIQEEYYRWWTMVGVRASF
jgi:TonB-dependent receptor